jgi:hypothetical protein
MKKRIAQSMFAIAALITSCGPVAEKENPDALKIEYDDASLPKIADAGIDDPLFGQEEWLYEVDKNYNGIFVHTDDPAINVDCFGDTAGGDDDADYRWWPNRNHRRRVMGKLDSYRGGTSGDWNLSVIPIAPFDSLLKINYRGKLDGDWWARGIPEDLVDYEGSALPLLVQPPDGLRQNPWFGTDNTTMLQPNDTICAYGAWVTHGEDVWDESGPVNPEIHPAELFWWRKHLEDDRSIDLYTMMVVQDASRDFDSGGDNYNQDSIFDCDHPTPWLENPLRATFRIAFICDPDGPCTNFVIGEYGGMYHNVTTSSDPVMKEDQGPGNEIQLIFNGKKILSVVENMMVDDDLGLKIEKIGMRSDGKIQGFIQLRTRVGDPRINDPGYHVLYALKSEAPSSYLMKKEIFNNKLPEQYLPRVNPNIELTFLAPQTEMTFAMRHRALGKLYC